MGLQQPLLVVVIVFAAVRAAVFTTRAAMFAVRATVFTTETTVFAAAVTMFATTVITVFVTAALVITVFITTAVLVVTLLAVLMFVLVVVAFCMRSNRHSNAQSSKQEKSFFHRKILSFNLYGTALGQCVSDGQARQQLRQNKGCHAYIMLI